MDGRDEGRTDLPSGGETLQLSPEKDDACALIGSRGGRSGATSQLVSSAFSL